MSDNIVMPLDELADILSTTFALGMVDAYFKHLSDLGHSTELTQDDVYYVSLALLYFLCQRGLFRQYNDDVTYSECLCAEITKRLENVMGKNSVWRFYFALDRFRQALREAPGENPHAVSLRHFRLVLGDPDDDEQCAGMAVWALGAGYLSAAQQAKYTLSKP